MQVSAANTRVELSKENLMRMYHIMLPPPPDLIARLANELTIENQNLKRQPLQILQAGFRRHSEVSSVPLLDFLHKVFGGGINLSDR